MQSYPIQAAEKATIELARELAKAFQSTKNAANLADLSAAIDAKDPEGIRLALGIYDGQWMALSLAVSDALSRALTPAIDGVHEDTLRSLDAPESAIHDASLALHHDALKLIQSAHAQIMEESLAGIEAAIALTLKDSRQTYTTPGLFLAAIGLSPKQATLLYGVMRAATILSKRLPEDTTEDARNHATHLYLATLPQLIAAPIRKLLRTTRYHLATRELDRLRNTYSQALFLHRLNPLADFQAHTAANTAQSRAWMTAQAIGILRPDARKFWLTMHDEKVRHTHSQVEALNPEGVPLDQPFQTPLGEAMAPPLERNCRCRIRLGVSHARH